MNLRLQLLLGYLLVFVLMIAMAMLMSRTTHRLIKLEDAGALRYETMTRAHSLQTSLVDMQSGKNKFIIYGQEASLKSFQEGRRVLEQTMANLKTLVSNNPGQLERLAGIEGIIERWLTRIALPEIEMARGGREGARIGKLIKEEGLERGLFEDMRERLRFFLDQERALLSESERQVQKMAGQSIWIVILGTAAIIIIGLVTVMYTSRNILRQVGGEPAAIAGVADAIARGNLDVEMRVDREAGNPSTGIYASLTAMLASLQANRDQTRRQNWLKTGLARLNKAMQGDPEIEVLASDLISAISTYLQAQVGAFYVAQDGEKLRLSLLGTYACGNDKNLSSVFGPGEGLVGQAALEKQQILIKNVPEDYVKVTSGLGERVPRFICVTPFVYERRVKGVVEIGTLNELSELDMEYLDQAMGPVAIAVEGARNRTRLTEALTESQRYSEELQSQQETLKTANEELEAQTGRLKDSEERLKTQQEEMEVANEELEEKNELLERQKRDMEQARKDIETQAGELALASKYKSEFLANMSHELRTPLNSLLLLAQDLARNKAGNLTGEQVESARIIHAGGSDLLNLINEILDLSKIEAGQMDLQLGTVLVSDLAEGAGVSFRHMAEEKGLQLDVAIGDDAPVELVSDHKRLEQVIRNLMSNALKFTESGTVRVTFGRPGPCQDLSQSGLSPDNCLAVRVQDTGPGIAPDQQKIIFQAFQQGEGGTARPYGGTGLGLSISRELAQLLGGEIQLASEPGKGATFTLYLPIKTEQARKPPERGARSAERGTVWQRGMRKSEPGTQTETARTQIENRQPEISDDRDSLEQGDRVVLIIEDDPQFAGILCQECHSRGFKCLAAAAGKAGLALAEVHLPDGILLDIRLPGMDGWTVLETLKENMKTRHIPVHVISVEEAAAESLRKGAIAHAVKPLTREELDQAFRRIEESATETTKRLLIVEDDEALRHSIKKLIGNGDVQVDEAATAEQALEALRAKRYGCLILDLRLPDMPGHEILNRIEAEGIELPPVIVHTACELTEQEEMDLRERAESIVIKDVRSQERLLDEVSLFLHRMVSGMPERKRQMIRDLHETDLLLKDKKVLVVDDDMRTTFALSHLLDELGMKPLKAENGERALRLLEQEPDVDLVLMDIMMPRMDGYETMRRIRAQKRFRSLPIIALTAKAMPEDRKKCTEAGASDYLPKPVDQDRLVSMMRVWLYR
ncbi:MAG: response regulator [Desulfohalobiaceae bacterium]|nr:response regulator [Desulfohalobiaceae bacterium]